MTNNLALHHHVWLPQLGATHTVVALHGTGGDESDLVPLARGIYPQANILGIRGNVNEGGANRFFRRFAEGMFDEADIKSRVKDLATFWQAASTEYGINPATTTWLGYSNGANTIAALLLGSDAVQNAVLLRAQAPFQKAPQTLSPTPAQVMLLSGEHDPIVPITESARLRDELTTRGHTVNHIRLPTGHQLSQMDLKALTTPAITT